MENFKPSKIAVMQMGYLFLGDLLSNTLKEKHLKEYSFNGQVFDTRYRFDCKYKNDKWLIDATELPK